MILQQFKVWTQKNMVDPALEVIYINALVKVTAVNEIIKEDRIKRKEKQTDLVTKTWGYLYIYVVE